MELNSDQAPALLRANELVKAYDAERRVLDAVSVHIAAGETVALLGPSGSGKSTLLHLLGAIDAPDEGTIDYSLPTGDVALATADDAARTQFRRRWLGFVFQFFNLIPTLNVRENTLLPRRLNRQSTSGDAAALARLATLGLRDRLDALPAQLSGGEQQRVAIARALAHQPVMVLADEPTGNLDAEAAGDVVALLQEHAQLVDAALVVATHSERVANQLQRVVRLG